MENTQSLVVLISFIHQNFIIFCLNFKKILFCLDKRYRKGNQEKIGEYTHQGTEISYQEIHKLLAEKGFFFQLSFSNIL